MNSELCYLKKPACTNEASREEPGQVLRDVGLVVEGEEGAVAESVMKIMISEKHLINGQSWSLPSFIDGQGRAPQDVGGHVAVPLLGPPACKLS